MRWQHCSPWLVGTGEVSCPVIGLTGSNGKTTTKELMKCVLEAAHSSVHATVGNFNNHTAAPTLLAARTEPDIAIIEMGANAQKEIALLRKSQSPTQRSSPTSVGRIWKDLEEKKGHEGKGGAVRLHPECSTRVPCIHARQSPQIVAPLEGLNRFIYGVPSSAPFVGEVHAEDVLAWVGLLGRRTDR